MDLDRKEPLLVLNRVVIVQHYKRLFPGVRKVSVKTFDRDRDSLICGRTGILSQYNPMDVFTARI